MIRYFLRREDWVLARATSGSSGYDLKFDGQDMIIRPREWLDFPTGLYLEMPQGIEAQIRSRSGLAAKHAISVLNSPGTIDSDYRGQLRVILINHGQDDFKISTGDRIAQLVFAPVLAPDTHGIAAELHTQTLVRVDSLSQLEDSSRGQSGFGSSGVK